MLRRRETHTDSRIHDATLIISDYRVQAGKIKKLFFRIAEELFFCYIN